MTVDNLAALNARDDLLWVVDHWDALAALVHPGSGHALTGIATYADEHAVPIDIHVSDLMRHIETQIAGYYARILLEEVPPEHGCDGACPPATPAHACPERLDPITTSTMPALLEQVARRFGHFTADGNDPIALGFCDDAHETRDRVHRTLTRPDPPAYIGPCPTPECVGELYLHPDHDTGHCRECGTEIHRDAQIGWLHDQLDGRLMTASEILSALVTLDLAVPEGTLRSWIHRARLVADGDGLYRLADAVTLAEARQWYLANTA